MDKFKSLLFQAGITGDLNNDRYNRTIERICQNSFPQVQALVYPDSASSLYYRYSMITSRTVEEYSALNIILDGELPGAISTHANFMRVIGCDSVIKVFKYPKDLKDPVTLFKIQLDATVCNLLRAANEGILPEGLVDYCPFVLKTHTNIGITGTLSRIYIMTLAQLRRPVHLNFLIPIVIRLAAIITVVHKLDFVFCDIKPENVFLDENCQAFIGDLEGVKQIGKPLESHTMEYLPEECINEKHATFACDWYCLISSALEMLNVRPNNPSIANLRLAISVLAPGALKEHLLSYWPGNNKR